MTVPVPFGGSRHELAVVQFFSFDGYMRPTHLALFAVFAVFAVVSCDRITPVEMTKTAITETVVRINIYAETNRAVPPSLDVLPRRNGYANRTTDGWGRPLQYRVATNGIITLTSFGRDAKPGGSGEDADVSESYFAKKPDESLWVGSAMWIVDAQVR